MIVNIPFEGFYNSAAYAIIARDYVSAFDSVASEILNLPLGLTFESMDSPREYNFTTDRLYAHIGVDVAAALFARSEAENHATLAAVIRERFTSRDGFISHYSNALPEWLEKPVADWDHNEIGTLLIAALRLVGADEDDDIRWPVHDVLSEDGGMYQAWESAVDWPRFEADREELREEKRAAADPDYVPPPERCPLTLDMFAP